MIPDIEYDFPQKYYQNTLEKTHLGLLTETHEVLLRLIKTPNIHVFKMVAPPEDRFLQNILYISKRPQWVGF